MRYLAFNTLLLSSLFVIVGCTSRPDIVIEDFESGTFESWTIEGDAFGKTPVSGAVDVQLEITGFEGKYLANSFHGGDDSRGIITSPEFKIERNFINFLLGGGQHDETYIELLIEGKRVMKSKPVLDSETLQWITWNVKAYEGKKAVIRVVDNQQGGWGHILVDNIEMSDKEKSIFLSNHEIIFNINKKYLLIPIQDQSHSYRVYLKEGVETLSPLMNICIAQSKVDYWIPIDVEQYKGKTISIFLESINKDNIGYAQIKQTDDFHFEHNEKYRPDFHFSPRYGWTNDPNGMVYYNGEYHLFYQHNPYGTMWGNMHWGHTVSKDLKKWEHLPVAISPDSLGTIFSGSMVVDKNNTAGFGVNSLVALYTYEGKEQTQGIAYSLDNGKTFIKYEGNPVLSDPEYRDFRDPKVFWDNKSSQWIMSLATGQTISIYASTNLKEWNKLSSFGDGIGGHGGVWECPDLFPLTYNGQTKWVLLVSINPGGPNGGSATQYFIGSFDGKTFKADNLSYPLWLDYGRDNYAGVTWSNAPTDRRIFIGWMSNWDYTNQTPTVNFRNAMTVPRELFLAHNGKHLILANYPVKEIEDLRAEAKEFNNIEISKKYTIEKLFENNDGSNEIVMTITTANVKKFGFKLLNRKKEELNFVFDLESQVLLTDRSKSGLVDFNEKFSQGKIEAPIQKAITYEIRLLIDKTSTELFVNGGKTVVTNIVFPSEPYNSLQFETDGGEIVLNSLKAYNLK